LMDSSGGDCGTSFDVVGEFMEYDILISS